MSDDPRTTTCTAHCWHEGEMMRDSRRYFRVWERCCFCDAKRIHYHGPYVSYPVPASGTDEYADADRDLPWDD
jgi:hypothetical protein